MSEKTIKITAQGAQTISMHRLLPFQGDLKYLERDQYEKLRRNIIELGFSFPFHVWLNEGNWYLIDGHQRLQALKLMEENEGWVVPDVPVVMVEAASMHEAKRKILAAASVYGRVSDQGLYQFMHEAEINLEELVSSFEFPEINMQKFGENFFQLEAEEIEPAAAVEEEKEMRSASQHVRQVQLFFDSEKFTEFMRLVDEHAKLHGTGNITDTIMAVMRAAPRS